MFLSVNEKKTTRILYIVSSVVNAITKTRCTLLFIVEKYGGENNYCYFFIVISKKPELKVRIN